jgi:hypothetical protein
MRNRSPLRSIANWSVKNSLARWIGRKSPDRYLLLRYEDLVSDPESELKRIGDACGLNTDVLVERLAVSGHFDAGHQIGGNLRARSQQRLVLKADDEWRRRLPRRYQALFWSVSGRLAKRLGYQRVER